MLFSLSKAVHTNDKEVRDRTGNTLGDTRQGFWISECLVRILKSGRFRIMHALDDLGILCLAKPKKITLLLRTKYGTFSRQRP